jgi:hypothetical protein
MASLLHFPITVPLLLLPFHQTAMWPLSGPWVSHIISCWFTLRFTDRQPIVTDPLFASSFLAYIRSWLSIYSSLYRQIFLARFLCSLLFAPEDGCSILLSSTELYRMTSQKPVLFCSSFDLQSFVECHFLF